jgi:pantoate--beta-alanine ligase
LNLAKELIAKGEKNSNVISHHIEIFMGTFPETTIEYISFCNPKTLERIDQIKEEVLLAIAVKLGKIRLIDNALINSLQ